MKPRDFLAKRFPARQLGETLLLDEGCVAEEWERARLMELAGYLVCKELRAGVAEFELTPEGLAFVNSNE